MNHVIPRERPWAQRYPRLRRSILVAKMFVSSLFVVGIVAGAYFFEANIVSRTTLLERLCLTIVACGAYSFYLLQARQAFDEWKLSKALEQIYQINPRSLPNAGAGLESSLSCSGEADGFDYDAQLAKRARRLGGG